MTNAKNRRQDYVFIICVVLLTAFGLIMLSSASSDLGKSKFNDTYYYLKHQIFYGLSFGLIGFFILNNFHYKNLKKLAVSFLIANIILLILIFTPLGVSHRGAARWLDIGPFSVQPAEFLKLSFIIYLAAWLSNKKFDRQTSFFKGLLPLMAISGLIAFLIFLQPATTIILIILTAALIVYFMSGAKISHIAGIIFLGIIFFSVLIYSSDSNDYRRKRIMTFLSGGDKQSSAYQINQTTQAIGSGGLFGTGFGKSTTKYKLLPEPIGDSIFAVIAEEFGLAGALALISTFFILIWRSFAIAKKSPDQFAKLMAIGFASIIAIQTFVHIAAISGILPLTGVPLPFISYGGTSLAVFLTMAGIIGNISKHT
ncbi:MAG: putative peptidoglycan glycosyltransferase FtsW [Patescibacteria group bacterium]